VDIVVKRSDGSAGNISCIVKTEPLTDKNADGVYDASNAVELEDYLPKYEQVTFATGEMDRTVSISIVNDKVHHIDGKPPGKTAEGDENSEDEELIEVMFKVIIEKAEPEGVRLSKRNCHHCVRRRRRNTNDARAKTSGVLPLNERTIMETVIQECSYAWAINR
jgi:hypothetical protein